jgi:hypothetical protein
MDRLVVLDRGRIVEQGDHRSLLALDGLYARLWAHQSGGFLGEEDDGSDAGATVAIGTPIGNTPGAASDDAVEAAVVATVTAGASPRLEPTRIGHDRLTGADPQASG